MDAEALTLRTNELRGTVLVVGENVFRGSVRITRSVNGTPEILRGGEFDVETRGFVKLDSEPVFGQTLTYRATLTVANRFIQSNRVLNPRAALNTSNVTPGQNRTLERETLGEFKPRRDSLTSFRVSPSTQIELNPTALYPSTTTFPGTTVYPQPTYSFASRSLLSAGVGFFDAGRWFITGQVMYDSPDLWLWEDARANGTWADLKAEGSWQQVLSSSAEESDQPFATLWAAVVSPTGTVIVDPFQVLGVRSVSGNSWHDFSAWVTVPPDAPANCRLVFLHGDTLREFACTWWLTTLMVSREYSSDTLFYFDGDSQVPDNPARNLVPGFNWDTVSNDAYMAWTGTPHASYSVFYGPSIIAVEKTTLLRAPTDLIDACEPLLISDPVAAQLNLWFGLLSISDLDYAERASLYDILGKGPQIAVSQTRAWANGQLTLMTKTLDEASVAERLFSSGRIVFMRNPDPRYPETNWYLHLGKITQGRLGPDHRRPERAWTLPFVRVERPVGLIEGSTAISWQNIKESGTWGDLRARRADWLDISITVPLR